MGSRDQDSASDNFGRALNRNPVHMFNELGLSGNVTSVLSASPVVGRAEQWFKKKTARGPLENATCFEAPIPAMLLSDRSITVLCALVSHLGVTRH